MADYSIISQDPAVRQYVQDGLLQREFHDALFPELKFRAMVEWQPWGEHEGDTKIFTGDGLYDPDTEALPPNQDPVPEPRQKEQWTATIFRLAKTGDVPMATSTLAPVDLFSQEAQAQGKQAGQSLNRKVRNRTYNAAMSGNTNIVGTTNSATQRVKHLNGLTRARRPDLAAGSPVRFDPVSSTNPLSVQLGAGPTTRNIIGFTPDNAGDEIGPGTITLDAVYNGTDRDAVVAASASSIVYVGGGRHVDDIGNTDVFTFAALRTAVARLRTMNVPTFPDGLYYAHVDPTTETQWFADTEVQRMLTSLPDYAMYRDSAIGNIGGTIVLRNTECPVQSTVRPKDGVTFTKKDDFAGELFSNGNAATGIPIHRPIVLGYGGLKEYWLDYMKLVSDAGMLGKVISKPRITSNGISIEMDRVYFLIRPPQNRLQDLPSMTWAWMGDFPFRTDATSGDAAAFKRAVVILHGQ